MNLHLRRLLICIGVCLVAGVMIGISATLGPHDLEFRANVVLTIATIVAAIVAFFAGQSVMDFRAQGISPQGFFAIDDRGHRKILHSTAVIAAYRRKKVSREAARGWLKSNRLPRRNSRWAELAFVCSALFLFFGGFQLLPIVLQYWSWLVAWFVLAVSFLSGLRGIVLAFREWYCRLAAAFGTCGACAYELQGSPAADDGCTVCPECGAAWRVEPTSPGHNRTS